MAKTCKNQLDVLKARSIKGVVDTAKLQQPNASVQLQNLKKELIENVKEQILAESFSSRLAQDVRAC